MLAIKIKGDSYNPLPGPLTGDDQYVEVTFTIGEKSYCGHFGPSPAKNDEKKIVFRGPSSSCVGEPEPEPPVEFDCPDGFECAVFNVLPGPDDLVPVDDATAFSWFRPADFSGFGAESGTNGEFSRGPLVMARGTAADPNGTVELRLLQTAYVGAPRPALGGPGKTCWKIEADPNAIGWLDCDGGSADDVELTVNSHGSGPAGPETLSVGVGAPGVAGAGILRVIVSTYESLDPGDVCKEVTYPAGQQTAFTIGTATATITEPIQGSDGESSLPGLAFDCTNWGTDNAASSSIAAPLFTLDVYLEVGGGLIKGTYDIANVLRLNLDSLDASAAPSVCGNGVLEGDEECDDGTGDPNSAADGDGCSATCTVEDGWECDEAEPTTCTQLVCGDGKVTVSLGEECDDNVLPPADGDGCSATCTVEDSWECNGEPSVCVERYCGDGVITASLGEACDDGEEPPVDGDGCSATCTVEDDYICTGQPSVCTSVSDLCPSGAEACAAFNILPGTGFWLAVPGEKDTFFQLFDFPDVGMSNVTDGQWGPSPIMLAKWAGGDLTWIGDSYIGATLNDDIQDLAAAAGTVCLHIRQDPADTGWLDCAGGVKASDVSLSVDSNFNAPDGAPILSLPDGPATGPAGTAVVRVEMQVVLTSKNGTDCNGVDYSGVEVVKTAFTTLTATSELLEPWLGSPPLGDPNVDQILTMDGWEFNCGTWGTGDGSISSIVAPLYSLGFPAPLPGNPPVDVAMMPRFELAQTAWPTGNEECGNGVIEAGELCDDGTGDPNSMVDGDGCSVTCTIESGWVCTGQPSVCHEVVCGDGAVEGDEQCDDGTGDPNSMVDGDGCAADCTVETGWSCVGEPSTCGAAECGDGYPVGTEECDDRDTNDGDGCSSTCTVEQYWACDDGAPSFCDGICGDGKIRGLEECDDGDADAGDGCSATCTVEDAWGCTLDEPSQCSNCGDDVVLVDSGSGLFLLGIGNDCDDGNTSNGDCCSATCYFETSGSQCTGDGNICTDDECDGAGNCEHNPVDGRYCDDGSACTNRCGAAVCDDCEGDRCDICVDGDCVGDFIPPWINEVDYSSQVESGSSLMVDYEEYVEIAAPAGSDLGGYRLVGVDGGQCRGSAGSIPVLQSTPPTRET